MATIPPTKGDDWEMVQIVFTYIKQVLTTIHHYKNHFLSLYFH